MIFNNFEAVYFTVLMLVPGFIMNMGYNYILPLREGQASIFIIRFIVFSCVNYALAWPLINKLAQLRYWEAHPFRWSLILGVILLLLPYVVGVSAGIVTQKDWIRKLLRKITLNPIHPLPTAWEYIMSQESRYVIITLKNEEVVYGLFSSKSLASSVPTEKDIYLEQIYNLSQTGEWKAQGKGAWINGSEILHIEFLLLENEENDKDDESKPEQ